MPIASQELFAGVRPRKPHLQPGVSGVSGAILRYSGLQLNLHRILRVAQSEPPALPGDTYEERDPGTMPEDVEGELPPATEGELPPVTEGELPGEEGPWGQPVTQEGPTPTGWGGEGVGETLESDLPGVEEPIGPPLPAVVGLDSHEVQRLLGVLASTFTEGIFRGDRDQGEEMAWNRIQDIAKADGVEEVLKQLQELKRQEVDVQGFIDKLQRSSETYADQRRAEIDRAQPTVKRTTEQPTDSDFAASDPQVKSLWESTKQKYQQGAVDYTPAELDLAHQMGWFDLDGDPTKVDADALEIGGPGAYQQGNGPRSLDEVSTADLAPSEQKGPLELGEAGPPPEYSQLPSEPSPELQDPEELSEFAELAFEKYREQLAKEAKQKVSPELLDLIEAVRKHAEEKGGPVKDILADSAKAGFFGPLGNLLLGKEIEPEEYAKIDEEDASNTFSELAEKLKVKDAKIPEGYPLSQFKGKARRERLEDMGPLKGKTKPAWKPPWAKEASISFDRIAIAARNQ